MQGEWNGKLNKTKVEIQEAVEIIQVRGKQRLQENSGSEEKGMEVNLRDS